MQVDNLTQARCAQYGGNTSNAFIAESGDQITIQQFDVAAMD
jgi:hypothetical protein